MTHFAQAHSCLIFPGLLAAECGQWKVARPGNPPLSPLPICRTDVSVQGDPGHHVLEWAGPLTAWVPKCLCGAECPLLHHLDLTQTRKKLSGYEAIRTSRLIC